MSKVVNLFPGCKHKFVGFDGECLIPGLIRMYKHDPEDNSNMFNGCPSRLIKNWSSGFHKIDADTYKSITEKPFKIYVQLFRERGQYNVLIVPHSVSAFIKEIQS